MIVINNIDSQRFTFNGVEYYKNFTPIVIGTKIRILNAYDSTIELTDSPRLFSEFEVDGLTYASVSLLQSALLPILYTRDTLGGGGAVDSVNGQIGVVVLDSTDVNALSNDIADYPTATLPLSDTDKLLVNQGGTFKEVAKNEISSVTKKWENYQFSTAGTNTIPNTNVNAAQVKTFNNSVFTNLSTSSGITETGGNLNLATLSDVGKARVTGNYTSKVIAIEFTYRRDVNESAANTNVMISIMSDKRYLVDMQLIARHNLVSTTAAANAETKVSIPVLSHLNLDPFSNLRWCIRSNNSTAQTFTWIDVNIITEEV